jgi:segregation and condensation protein B
MDYSTLKSVLEGLLFVSGEEGLSVKAMAEVVEMDPDVVSDVLQDLRQDLIRDGRGIRISETAGGFRLTSVPEHAPYLEKLAASPVRSQLSQAALETLSIIAYRQPITRIEIEEIRGVKADRAIQTLLARDLIEEVGRAEALGRPILYGTTKTFLDCFGLSSLEQLPDPNALDEDEDMKERTKMLFERIEGRQLSLEDVQREMELY